MHITDGACFVLSRYCLALFHVKSKFFSVNQDFVKGKMFGKETWLIISAMFFK